jgi:transcriptional regulator with XRE-family HTH domain
VTRAPSPLSLSERLLDLRERKMLTQAEAAEEIGISRRAYQDYEAGDSVPRKPSVRRRIDVWLNGGSS